MSCVVFCQASRRSTKRSKRASVSRETGVNAKASVRSEASGLGTTFAAMTAGTPNVSDEQGQCRGRHAIDPAGLADGSGLDGRELLASLVGEPFDPGIVQAIGKLEAFVPAESRNVGSLAAEIDMVLGVDLKLLKDPAREVAQGRPNALKGLDPDAGEREQIKGRA